MGGRRTSSQLLVEAGLVVQQAKGNDSVITIPVEAMHIGKHAFVNWRCLKECVFAAGSIVESIDDSAFRDTALRSIVLPASLKEIGPNAFDSVSSLAQVTFCPNGELRGIADYAFYQCAALKELRIPASLKVVGNRCFCKCVGVGLVEFDAESELRVIGDEAFFGCTRLRAVSIPAPVERVGASAFMGCSALQEVGFAGNSELCVLRRQAFRDCGALVSVAIPRDVGALEEMLFAECRVLKNCTFGEPSRLADVRKAAFRACDLREMRLPSSVRHIRAGAFSNCFRLRRVELPGDAQAERDALPSSCTIVRYDAEHEEEGAAAEADGADR